MKEEEIQTAMAIGWLELQEIYDAHGETLSERDQQMWTIGFLQGAEALVEKCREIIKVDGRTEP